MRERTWRHRVARLLEQEAGQPEVFWWLSFADDSGFLGAILTKARGFASAIQKTHRLGINPGGECRGVPIPAQVLNPELVDRLLSEKDIEANMGGVELWK